MAFLPIRGLKQLKNIGKADDGAAMLEYTVLIGLILVAGITFVLFAGNWVADQWQLLQTTLESTS